MEEIWKDVPSMPGYQASNLGRVRSLLGGGFVKHDGPRILSLHQEPTSGNYLRFSTTIDGKKGKRYVHRAVLEAFNGLPPKDMECGHTDGNPHNNKLENLEWVTRKENIRQNLRNGTFSLGSKHYASKISEADVREIRRLFAFGVFQSEIAKRFGISQAGVSNICRRKVWKHVP